VVVIAGADHAHANAVAYALERRLFDCNASAVVLPAGVEARVSTASLLSDGGLLAIVAGDASTVDDARARLEGRRVLFAWLKDGERVPVGVGPADLVLDRSPESPDGASEALLEALRERGWVGR
jgi:hypothetical protein